MSFLNLFVNIAVRKKEITNLDAHSVNMNHLSALVYFSGRTFTFVVLFLLFLIMKQSPVVCQKSLL